jgi:hypothetical protein
MPDDRRDGDAYVPDNRAELDLLFELSKRLAAKNPRRDENDDEL